MPLLRRRDVFFSPCCQMLMLRMPPAPPLDDAAAAAIRHYAASLSICRHCRFHAAFCDYCCFSRRLLPPLTTPIRFAAAAAATPPHIIFISCRLLR